MMDDNSELLSQLIVNTKQRLVIIKDDTGRERYASEILRRMLVEQDVDPTNIQTLPADRNLQDISYLSNFLAECRANGKKQANLYIVLPTLADLLCYMKPSMLFELLHELRCCVGVQCTFLWASRQHLIYSNLDYLLSACEYVCDTVVHLEDEHRLVFGARKPGGGVINKSYSYKRYRNGFLIESTSFDAKNTTISKNDSITNPPSNLEHGSTHKIELEEEELVARSAMKLPYEKTSESTSVVGNIVYAPDVSDDLDEEDPDEDLCI